MFEPTPRQTSLSSLRMICSGSMGGEGAFARDCKKEEGPEVAATKEVLLVTLVRGKEILGGVSTELSAEKVLGCAGWSCERK